MEIKLEKKDAVNGQIKINLIESDYLPQFERKIKDFSKKVAIKGFRPGKVPSALVHKMYGKSIMVDEMNKIVSDSLQKYIDDNKLNIVGNPIPESLVDSPEDFFDKKEHQFSFKIGMVPDFALADPKPNTIVKYAIEVSDERVKESIEEVKNIHAAAENVEEVTDAKDLVFGDLKEVNGSFATFGLIPMDKVFDSVLKKFMGKRIDDTVEFDIRVAFSNDDSLISYATGIQKEKLDELTSDFSLKITRISRQKPAELSQELFDKVYGKDQVSSEAEFVEKLKQTIAENYTRETEAKFGLDVRQYLIDNTQMELPLEFLKEWLIYTSTKEEDKAEVERNFNNYTTDFKWQLIKENIVAKHKHEIKYEDVKAKTIELFKQQYGIPVDNHSMDDSFSNIADNFLSAENGKNFANLYRQVQFEKAYNDYIAQIVPQTVPTTLEKFKELSAK